MIAEAQVSTVPKDENAIDIFKGHWITPLNENLSAFHTSDLSAFPDQRVVWACSEIGDIAGYSVLELGPLEAADTCVLEHCGAASILSVEPSTKSFLKCLIVKELGPLTRTQFLCGDYLEFLRHNSSSFDLCVASGVLYRVINPVELLARCARASDRLYLWTHYYDPEILSKSDGLFGQFSAGTEIGFEGFRCTAYEHRQETANWHGFHHGSVNFSFWMTREDILACLRCFGFVNITTHFEQPDHPYGPSFALVATTARASETLASMSARETAVRESSFKKRWYPADEPIVTQAEVFDARLNALRSRLDALEVRVNRYANAPPLRWLRNLRSRTLGLPHPR